MILELVTALALAEAASPRVPLPVLPSRFLPRDGYEAPAGKFGCTIVNIDRRITTFVVEKAVQKDWQGFSISEVNGPIVVAGRFGAITFVEDASASGHRRYSMMAILPSDNGGAGLDFKFGGRDQAFRFGVTITEKIKEGYRSEVVSVGVCNRLETVNS